MVELRAGLGPFGILPALYRSAQGTAESVNYKPGQCKFQL